MPAQNFISMTHALTVAEQGSFNLAATWLGVKQTVISRRIRPLEEDLGVSLLKEAVTAQSQSSSILAPSINKQ